MSQFILCRGSNQKIASAKVQTYPFTDPFLNTVSDYLWKNAKNNIYTVTAFDELCTEAQELVQKNVPFENTQLFSTLRNILEEEDEIVLWYGEYFNDLPKTTDQNELLEIVKDSIAKPACETYIWYTKNN